MVLGLSVLEIKKKHGSFNVGNRQGWKPMVTLPNSNQQVLTHTNSKHPDLKPIVLMLSQTPWKPLDLSDP